MRAKKEVIVFVSLFALLFLSSIVLAVNCPIPDTGQTKCYDDNSEISCPQQGENFYGQDAQYSCNPHSYTKLDENGNDLHDNATEWVMVRDNVTELIWEVKTDDGTIHDKDNTYNWNDAQSVFITTLNNDNFGGYSDWRLPTVMELSFLVDRDRYGPSINTTYFPNTESSYYWSSTTDANDPYVAWLVGFDDGYMNLGKSYGYYVRAVRAGQCGSFDNFIDNGDGTVTNTDTGLMWQQDIAPGTYNWQEALSFCETLTLALHNDWRLPNVNELHSIVDYNTYDPSINTTYFPNTESSYYWSSTTLADSPGNAWYVDFGGGGAYGDYKSDCYYYVRAVRAGQCESLHTSTTTTTISPQPFTLDGTEWSAHETYHNFYRTYGFYQGKVYREVWHGSPGTETWEIEGEYWELFVISYFHTESCSDVCEEVNGLLIPFFGIGFGDVSLFLIIRWSFPMFFNKVNDSWSPPE